MGWSKLNEDVYGLSTEFKSKHLYILLIKNPYRPFWIGRIVIADIDYSQAFDIDADLVEHARAKTILKTVEILLNIHRVCYDAVMELETAVVNDRYKLQSFIKDVPDELL